MSHFEKVTFERWKADCGVKGLSDKDLRDWYDSIKLPRQATAGSAGCDLYMPFSLSFEAGSTFRIATGLRWVTDPGERDRVLLIIPRSGLGSKYGIRLPNTIGVIDADYANAENEGHILVPLVNPSDQNVPLAEGSAFAQGIVVRYEVPEGSESSEVRNGGFGSTDQKQESRKSE